MSVNQLLKLINAETLLDHFPISLIFEKLELDVNVTRIQCPAKNDESNSHDCVFNKFEDHKLITTQINKNNVSSIFISFYKDHFRENYFCFIKKHYLFVNDHKIRCMNPNLAIFNEIGKKVDRR
jgi:hypothetical protein